MDYEYYSTLILLFGVHVIGANMTRAAALTIWISSLKGACSDSSAKTVSMACVALGLVRDNARSSSKGSDSWIWHGWLNASFVTISCQASSERVGYADLLRFWRAIQSISQRSLYHLLGSVCNSFHWADFTSCLQSKNTAEIWSKDLDSEAILCNNLRQQDQQFAHISHLGTAHDGHCKMA